MCVCCDAAGLRAATHRGEFVSSCAIVHACRGRACAGIWLVLTILMRQRCAVLMSQRANMLLTAFFAITGVMF